MSLVAPAPREASDTALSLGEFARAARLVADWQGCRHADLLARTRGRAPIAAARQVAMYLCHVGLGASLTAVGAYFGRDRTTVAHACILVEDRRDDAELDATLDAMETRLLGSRNAQGREDAP